MNADQVLDRLREIIATTAKSKGASVPCITADTVLLGGGLPLDSLDLAGLVVELENATGIDPFREGFVNFRTAGELARLYGQ
jgi:acyl carrier protein